MGVFDIVDEVAVKSGRARIHEAGWQSWSPTGTYLLSEPSPRPGHEWQQVMRFRPGSPAPATGFQSKACWPSMADRAEPGSTRRTAVHTVILRSPRSAPTAAESGSSSRPTARFA
jgi:hypothetical protein